MTARAFKGTTYKRCTCTDPATKKQLGPGCPKLKRSNGAWSSNHGSWSFQAELPKRHDGTRRTRRRHGFASQTDAQAELDKIAALIELGTGRGGAVLTSIGDLIENRLSAGEPFPSPEEVVKQLDQGATSLGEMPTVGEWLQSWVITRKKIREGTRIGYRSHIRHWLIPHLGHYRLDVLTVEHISRMFDAMAERNDTISAAKESDDPEIRKSVHGMRITGAATMQRYRATLRAALNAAIRAQKITFNPASYVELPSGRRPKALLWTPDRVERWRRTGQKPSRVMVWTPEQIGRFLDQAEGHPYYALFHLIAYRGLRRGEACGLPWWNIDLPNQSITISTALVQIGWQAEFGEPKSEASGRIIALDEATTLVLRRQKKHQNELRAAAGAAWVEHELVCTEPDGSPLHPAKLTDAFHAIADAAELPPVRLHDLRHGAATLMLAAGADLKVVQELLGHSTIAVTADTYSHVLPELARETAEAAASIVPRNRRRNRPTAA
ncbi:site-specific recombinase XerD [Saccharomonospora marina XMU15]|uniref:Site-specific recombinase XerD n=1 Tax=Saccharomonospora marina XMU15 TaxID=882083 RepID=H5X840_9PSEU|nr:tyrosine-type recombinase/integrase [Saccharomonospora marina]EHR53572.1 site-specific recombinase XerD [Saccharomonospora marina XMU15]